MSLKEIIKNSLDYEGIEILNFKVLDKNMNTIAKSSADNLGECYILVKFEGLLDLEEIYNSNHGLQLYGKEGKEVKLKGVEDGELLLESSF